jgi:uncharacterized membrane protein YdjX (TVP38/TMEM64 family)
MKSPRFSAKMLIIFAVVLVLLNLFLITMALAQENEGDGKFHNAVSVEGKTGISLVIANLYNNQRLLFALGGTLFMAAMGLSLGQILEMVIKALGIKRPRKS